MTLDDIVRQENHSQSASSTSLKIPLGDLSLEWHNSVKQEFAHPGDWLWPAGQAVLQHNWFMSSRWTNEFSLHYTVPARRCWQVASTRISRAWQSAEMQDYSRCNLHPTHTLTAPSLSSHFKENHQEPLGNGSSYLPTIFGAFGPRFAYIGDRWYDQNCCQWLPVSTGQHTACHLK